MLNVFIGYDERETVAAHVLAHSIQKRASRPVFIAQINLNQLAREYWRERDPKQSTDFTYARFLTPFLSRSAVSVFVDCDFLCLSDITELEDEALANPHQDVLVVKHAYVPTTQRKFLNQEQTCYPCKNWSSLMVFNNHRVRGLTPEYVNKASPMDLHQFKWAKSVGELSKDWNHLVGEYDPNPNAKMVHFTIGGPWFKPYEKCEYAQEWFQEFQDMTKSL